MCTVSVVMATPADSCEFIPNCCSYPILLYCTCTLCSPVQHCTVHVHCVHSPSTGTVHVRCVYLYNTVLYMYVHCVHLYNTVVYMYIVFTCTAPYCTCMLCSPVQHCTVHVPCVLLYNSILYMYFVFTCTTPYRACIFCSPVQHHAVHVHCVHLYNTVLHMFIVFTCTTIYCMYKCIIPVLKVRNE